jgi:hypothetical protein
MWEPEMSVSNMTDAGSYSNPFDVSEELRNCSAHS